MNLQTGYKTTTAGASRSNSPSFFDLPRANHRSRFERLPSTELRVTFTATFNSKYAPSEKSSTTLESWRSLFTVGVRFDRYAAHIPRISSTYYDSLSEGICLCKFPLVISHSRRSLGSGGCFLCTCRYKSHGHGPDQEGSSSAGPLVAYECVFLSNDLLSKNLTPFTLRHSYQAIIRGNHPIAAWENTTRDIPRPIQVNYIRPPRVIGSPLRQRQLIRALFQLSLVSRDYDRHPSRMGEGSVATQPRARRMAA